MSGAGDGTIAALWHAVLIALVLVALNAAKPLTVDDPLYYEMALHLARHPLDPYGGQATWGGGVSAQFDVIAPPLFAYWWAVAIALFGDSELAWKLWLLPIALLLALAVLRLGRRFAPGLEVPLAWIVALSPPVLVGFNLMLDVPVLALGLAAVAVFVEATDRGRPVCAAAAGLLAAAAMQTKYNAVLAIPAAMLIYAWLARRPWYGVGAAVVAALGFAALELPIVLARGQSHFLAASSAVNAAAGPLRIRNLRPLFTLIGEAAPVLLPMALLAAGVGWRWVVAAIAALAASYAMIAVDLRAWTAPGAGGLAMWIGLIAATWRALRVHALPPEARRDICFLALWLAVEIVVAQQTAPFPAVRRFTEPIAVAALLLAAIAVRASLPMLQPAYRRLAVFAAGVGLLFEAVDVADAWNHRRAAEIAAARAMELAGPRTTWFSGAHGFNHYAQRSGLSLAQPGRTTLRAGDVLVVAQGAGLEAGDAALAGLRLVETQRVGLALPLRTLLPFYVGPRAIDHNPQGERGILLSYYAVAADGRLRRRP